MTVPEECNDLIELIDDAEDWLRVAERTEEERAACLANIARWRAEIEALSTAKS